MTCAARHLPGRSPRAGNTQAPLTGTWVIAPVAPGPSRLTWRCLPPRPVDLRPAVRGQHWCRAGGGQKLHKVRTWTERSSRIPNGQCVAVFETGRNLRPTPV